MAAKTLEKLNHGNVLAAAVVLAGVALGIILGALLNPAESSPTRTVVVSLQRTNGPASASAGTSASVASAPFLDPNVGSSLAQLQDLLKVDGTFAVAVASVSGGSVVVLGANSPAAARSLIAVPIVAALLDKDAQTALTDSDAGLASQAIGAGSLTATRSLFSGLASGSSHLGTAANAVQNELIRSGDHATQILAADPTLTEWSPGASARFFLALARGCPTGSAAAYLQGLMRAARASEPWGLTDVYQQSHAIFAGGWGPQAGGGFVVRQAGLIRLKGSNFAVSIVAHPTAQPLYSNGQTIVTRVANWLVDELRPGKASPATVAACPRTS